MAESSSEGKFEIKETDMDDGLTELTTDLVKQALKLYSVDKDVAAFVKEEMDKRMGPTWHCVVGRSFGSRVSYEMSHFMLLKVNKTSVMIFKCGY